MLNITNWMKLAHIFQYSIIAFQFPTHCQGACINSCIHFFSGHAPNSLGGVILAYSGQYFNHQLLERDFFHGVILPTYYHAWPSFYHSCYCTEPPIDRKMLLQLTAGWEYCLSHQCNRIPELRFLASIIVYHTPPPPALGSHLLIVLSPCSSNQRIPVLNLIDWHYVLVHAYVDICFHCQLILLQHHFSDSVHYWGDTLRPNPTCIKQYLPPFTMTIWYGHCNSWICIWRHAFHRSSKATLTPCCHSLIFLVHTSVFAVMWHYVGGAPSETLARNQTKGLDLRSQIRPEVGKGTWVEELDKGTQRKAVGDGQGRRAVSSGHQTSERPVAWDRVQQQWGKTSQDELAFLVAL